MTQKDVARMMAEMNRLAGMVRTEAETTPGIQRGGELYVSIREKTANALLLGVEQWKGELGTLLDDQPLKVTG